MSTDIIGWVEIKRNNYWFGVVRIDSLMSRNYRMFDFLFGGRSGNYDTALAGKRGIPQDRSPEVREHWGDSDGIEGTWIGWSEIQAIDWLSHDTIVTDDWQRLFDIMRLLSQSDLVEDVRLIVDFF
jgi:hypothetical protein